MGKYDREIAHLSEEIGCNEEIVRDHGSPQGPKWLGEEGAGFIADIKAKTARFLRLIA
jgi:hypothetical protein